jgi:hypothetical protein
MTLRLMLLFLFAATALPGRAEVPPKVWRVDCGAEPANASVAGYTLHSLAEANAKSLQPDDQLLFRRGTICHGFLSPQGSGSVGHPIRISAYGSGPRPRIEASGSSDSAVQLRDQQWIEIDSLDVSGSRLYGVHVVATHGVCHHLALRDLTVHDVRSPAEKVKTKESGLVVVHSTTTGAAFDDVTIDGILAFGTTQWAGILVSGTAGSAPTSHVVIRNSMVHDVQGDGIVLFRLADGVIENSVAWHTGMQETESIGTPNGIWTWACTRCTVQNNEAFLTDSPGVDGGAFDIDFWNDENSVLNNYGHDTQGYCVSVFGAYSPATTGSVIRGNLCVSNGLSPRLAKRQGAIFFATWDGGSIRGVRVEQNTVYFDPPGPNSAIQALPNLNAEDIFVEENAIDSAAKISVDAGIAENVLKKDRYQFRGNKVTHDGFPQGVLPNTTAPEPVPSWAKVAAALDDSSRGWKLVVAVPELEEHPLPRSTAGQLMLLRSQAWQYGGAPLQIILACPCRKEDREALEMDWEFAAAGIRLSDLPASSPTIQTSILFTPSGQAANVWTGALSPSTVGMVLRQALGIPRFAGLPPSHGREDSRPR